MSDQGASSTTWSPAPVPESSRYYCHTCEAEFDNVIHRNDEVLCQNCNNGFIEMIATAPESNAFDSSSQGSDDEDRQFLTSIIQEAFQRSLGLPVQFGQRDPRLQQRQGSDNVHRISATIRNPGQQPLEHILSDLFMGIGGGAGFGQEGGNSPLFFVGNPGDYAWGREGLDAIVTQLLNQMDGSGPPPLPTDKIKQIPVAHITKAQIDSNLQCSVCWEAFSLDEEVRRLPCDHFYHTPCIEPWLQLHGTCPICRQTLHSAGEPTEPAGGGGVAVNFANLASAAIAPGTVAASMAESLYGGNVSGLSLGDLASALGLGGARQTPSRPANPTTADSSTANSSNPTGDTNSSSNPSGRYFYDMDFD